ncbi:1,2-phenylacetyl-CoA epoxidase subunit PaaD [Polymorphum gilvum]|uniref:Phenylacetate-CoA oxygenase, PaaJ subunit n=1 Tax=Polymorphum gilvum (strain LMG 25793 / CGMCC 1.9160 / SL003B-26A1) TaxID=991905 RepID=F2IYV8_POLGS|nr:1,2-phenylacetyl-CoA epoxidase subunit PaaD [Polymorphum gilvum]ADZ70573.1 Phenylacetate-CoA oxygenase, PaaJ subunit [Polymorphum gilvum SL003B-26A1]
MTAAARLPSVEDIWGWLEEVPDPEIPVLSLVDLGVIRSIGWDGGRLVVKVTPTYSGCPATSVINFEIEKALRDHGITDLVLERQLSPAWTTDWISESGREKLRAYGIAPPVAGTAVCGSGGQADPVVACPRCGSTDTAQVSRFGSTPCKAAYRCNACLEPFDYFKCI